MNNSIKEFKKDEGGASMKLLEDKINSLEEELWRRRRDRMNKALAFAQTAQRLDPARMYTAARRLADIIEGADVEAFISVIEMLANQINLFAIFNFLGLSRGSLLHIAAAAGKDDILKLLLDHVNNHLITAKNDWGDTCLHLAAKAGHSRAATMLICRARDLPNVEDNNRILRMKNEHGNTALHEAMLNHHVNMVFLLLREDLEPMYWMNADQKSPLYLALDNYSYMMHGRIFSLSLEPSKIQGLPPVHGAVVRHNYDVVPNSVLLIPDLVAQMLRINMQLFAMTDSKGNNIFHLAAYLNQVRVFEFLQPETEYLVREKDKNGDLPIHIASKMGYVELIKKLYPESEGRNRREQTILHIAAKYGRTSVVRYILNHPKLGMMIDERDRDGNTPLHLAAMYSQPASLIPLVLDERIDLFRLNHKCLTALDIALDRVGREYTLRKQLAVMVLASTIGKSPARNEAFSAIDVEKKKPNMDHVKNLIGNRLVVATLVATVTFAAGFAVPGGFNSSDMASKDDRGMASMLDNRMFQAFAICNTIAMFCSMIAVVALLWAQQNDVHTAIVAYRHSMLPLRIALPAMSAAFLTGVTLTVGKLPWLANTIFYLGLVFLLIISVAKLLEDPPLIWSHRRPIRIMVCWLVLAYVYLWEVETDLLDDSKEDRTDSWTSARGLSDGVHE